MKESQIVFRMDWQKTAKHLAPKIVEKITETINPGRDQSSIYLNSQDEITSLLKKVNIIINGQSLISLIRERIRVDEPDILLDNYYELQPYSDTIDVEKMKVFGNPSGYYDRHIECEHCGRYQWKQNKDLVLRNKMVNDFAQTDNGEILFSNRLKMITEKSKLQGFSFRRLAQDRNVWQLIPSKTATIKIPNKFLKEINKCTVCGKPRLLRYEDTNDKELFKPPYDRPRIERTPIVELQDITGDFSATELEFGTSGIRQEGSPPINVLDFPYKRTNPKYFLSGKMCKVLLRAKVKSFEIIPVNIRER